MEIKKRFNYTLPFTPNTFFTLDTSTTVMLIAKKDGSHKTVLLDTEDIPRIKNFRWGMNGEYVMSNSLGRGNHIMLSNLLMSFPQNNEIDHISRDTLDNRKSNLRLCSRAENTRNRGKLKTRVPVSKYKGVALCIRGNCKRFRTYIHKNNKHTWVGSFKTEVEAAQCYNNTAKITFGDFACLNIIDTNS